jgi:hypothetical protein
MLGIPDIVSLEYAICKVLFTTEEKNQIVIRNINDGLRTIFGNYVDSFKDSLRLSEARLTGKFIKQCIGADTDELINIIIIVGCTKRCILVEGCLNDVLNDVLIRCDTYVVDPSSQLTDIEVWNMTDPSQLTVREVYTVNDHQINIYQYPREHSKYIIGDIYTEDCNMTKHIDRSGTLHITPYNKKREKYVIDEILTDYIKSIYYIDSVGKEHIDMKDI